MSISFNSIVFGPIHSRRLGTSLGVNLLPSHGKLCSFDCIYCECGWNKDGRADTVLPSKDDVFKALEEGIRNCYDSGIKIDTITFSGNGEPTLHPDFPEIIERTLALRDKYYPESKVSVLSNATFLSRVGVKEAMAKVDNPILKLDSSSDEFARIIDRPQSPDYSISSVIDNLKWFKGDFVLQTMFLRGVVDGREIDCSDPELVSGWLRMVAELKPRQVMIYTLDRIPPLATLSKISKDELEEIAAPVRELGIEVIVAG